MRVGTLLAQLALWTPFSHAFYPYNPEWRLEAYGTDEDAVKERGEEVEKGHGAARFAIKRLDHQTHLPIAERALRDASRWASRLAGRQWPDDLKLPSKRDNQHHVMKADKPTKSLSQGIDQDGTDYSYFIEVQLGSQNTPLYLLIDSGAGYSWVMSDTCQSKACLSHNTFVASGSTTHVDTNRPFSIAYGTGQVSGNLINDTITVAGLRLEFEIGLAEKTSDALNQFAFDGILGLSMNSDTGNFLKTLADSKHLKNNIFCVALNRGEDGTNNGELSFGSPDKDKYTGEITYTDLQPGKEWSIALDDFSYDGKKAGVGGIDANIDTGTTYIFGPKDKVKQLHDSIPGSQSSDGMSYTVPCDSNKALTVTFSGVDYEISAKDWISPKSSKGKCTSLIYGQEVVKGSWLLGDTFLKNVYTVFDQDKRRIGFAKSDLKADSADKQSSASTASMPSKTSTSEPDKTSSSSSETHLGLGHELVSTSSATADTADPKKTKGSSSAGVSIIPVSYILSFCIATFWVCAL